MIQNTEKNSFKNAVLHRTALFPLSFKDNIKVILLFCLGLFSLPVHADEGMFLPVNVADQQEKMEYLGSNLTAKEIYDPEAPDLQDAIVLFGEGCTGEIISSEGLLLTNHHCGYHVVHALSTANNNLLEDGFWAGSREEEIPFPGLTASFLISTHDITDSILPEFTNDLKEYERNLIAEDIGNKLIEKFTEGTHYTGKVHSFYGGNKYYLSLYEVFEDVRLVGAPPSSIGKFGSDTDNWMWPRHNADFSLFRIYADSNNKPATYSENNVPFKPRHVIPISLEGYSEGDFALVMGFAGATQRYITSFEIKELLENELPLSIKIREKRQQIMMQDMKADEEVRIKYADKYYMQSSNYWKFFVGQVEGLKKNNIIHERENLEKKFQRWADSCEKEKGEYSTVLSQTEELIGEMRNFQQAENHLFEGLYMGIEFVTFAFDIYETLYPLEVKDIEESLKDSLLTEAEKTGNTFFQDYNPSTDQKFAKAMISMYLNEQQSYFYPDVFSKPGFSDNKLNTMIKRVYQKSIFTNRERFLEFIKHPNMKKMQKDPGYELAMSVFYKSYDLYGQLMDYEYELQKLNREFQRGLMQMDSTVIEYADANSTLRFSYGRILNYQPRDAVYYSYYTTLKGVMEKEIPDSWEFHMPDKLKLLYLKKDYGKYGEAGQMRTCFLTDNDTTGGNSGSPVVNKDGELIGIAFDGNWEALTGDIHYDPDLQRSINVDIRYVLFIIDKYAQASHLIKEMQILN